MPEPVREDVLSRFSGLLVERLRSCTTVSDLCDMVAGFCAELLPDDLVVISLYDPKLHAITIRKYHGLGTTPEQVLKILGQDPRRMAIKVAEMTPAETARFCSGRLERVPGGVHELLARRLPRPVCQAAQRLLGVDACYVVGFALEGQPYGGLTLLRRRPGPLPEAPYLELLCSLVSLAIRQRQAEQERAELEKRLQRGQKMEAIGTLAGGIAHDFNNLLAAIMGFAELAQDDLVRGEPAQDDPARAGLAPGDPTPVASARQHLAAITNSATKARNLVRQILTFSREMEVRSLPLSLNQVVAETCAMLSRTLPKMVSLELDLAEDLPLVQADPQQMEQVIFNLATNAADALEGGGTIYLATRGLPGREQRCAGCAERLVGPQVLLTVRDQGPGMSPEVREKIFEPFFTTKGVGQGTGLGLATVYGSVGGAGGHICCQSRPGEGAQFLIYLPAAGAAQAAASPAAGAGDESPAGRGAILVVDDEDDVREITGRMLRRRGYRVRQAQSGEEALDIYAANQDTIDLVMLDLGMPGMGGEACLAEIQRRNPRAKVLVVTGYTQYEFTDRLTSLGAAGLVFKPVRQAELLARIKELLP